MSDYQESLKSHTPKKAFSSWAKRLFDERKAGTGPHSGKNGPLVTNRKQILAIAASKARRGE